MSRKQKKNLIRILIAFALFIAAYIIPAPNKYVKFVYFLIPYGVCGWDVVWGSLRKIGHGQLFDEQFLMMVATLGAFALGVYKEGEEFAEGVAVMLFYQIGEWFQSVAVGRSRRSIVELMDIRPDIANVLRDGVESEVDPEEVAVGETIIVRPGEKIPLDGVITSGSTTINAAALTGESLPQDKAEGDRVISGSINMSGLIDVRTESEFGDSTVAKILELVENSSTKKARVENFITRFARWYTPIVVISAALLAIIPPLFTGGGWSDWIERALVFLVVSCPCALVVSVPLSFFGGLGGASKLGILIKGSNYMEALAAIDTIVFDKTGTLTRGNFSVAAIQPNGCSETALMSTAALLESQSNHPIARSICAAAGDIDSSRISGITEISGRGISAQIDGKEALAGNALLMQEHGISNVAMPDEVGTAVHVALDGLYMGYIIIADEIKPDSAEAIAALRNVGVKRTVMLTGDNLAVGEAVAQRLGIDEAHCQLLPAQKVDEVERLMTDSDKLAFVGDGINDAPVLMRADVGIAMGALGSDAAIEAADVVLMDDKPSKLPVAIGIARRTMRIVWQNIIFALGVKILILILGACGIANMWLAVFGDVGVLVLAILNAMRALRVRQ